MKSKMQTPGQPQVIGPQNHHIKMPNQGKSRQEPTLQQISSIDNDTLRDVAANEVYSKLLNQNTEGVKNGSSSSPNRDLSTVSSVPLNQQRDPQSYQPKLLVYDPTEYHDGADLIQTKRGDP